jgi:hypothetical protein
MKQVDEMPTSGQFVAVWVEDCGLCADTLVYVDGTLFSIVLSEPVDKAGFKSGELDRQLKYFIAD